MDTCYQHRQLSSQYQSMMMQLQVWPNTMPPHVLRPERGNHTYGPKACHPASHDQNAATTTMAQNHAISCLMAGTRHIN